MAAGLRLAGLAEGAWAGGLGGLDDDELTGFLGGWQRLGARAAAAQFAAVRELAARR
ncbi:MAG: hypothetical protein QOJ73_317, partial [Streptosporangiaceae bacterium]|nr:hypothetical protein [Streptosporangiaceae bacterium]